MDYEKLHKDTINRLQQMVGCGKITVETACGICADFVPESEDERISKEIIKELERKVPHHHRDEVLKLKEWIAWLEKKVEQKPIDKIQLGKKYKCIASPRYSAFMTGEIYKPEDKFLCSLMNFCSDCFEPIEEDVQKHTDKVEPKFKVGDLITNGILVGEIDEIHELGYHAYFGDHYADVPDIEKWHKWTIQDAKDGDILYARGSYFKEYLFMFSSFTEDNVISTHFGYDVFHGTFDKKLTRFGREEDFTSVIPATKEQRDLLFQKMKEAGYEWDAEKKELKKIEQKPVWSEEDEWKFSDIMALLRGGENCHYNTPELSEWFKSIIDRVQPKQEWSEEDKNRINRLIAYFEDKESFSAEDDIVYANWLKSLRPQTRWKPSEGQMEFLKKCIEAYNEVTFPTEVRVLSSLYNDLKKLRKE